jgi:hypothetical protein
MEFSDIDFKGGRCRYIEPIGEDMLEVCYPNGFMIDVGYIEETKTFYVTIIKDNDWVNIHKEISAKTETELKNALRYAIDYVTRL